MSRCTNRKLQAAVLKVAEVSGATEQEPADRVGVGFDDVVSGWIEGAESSALWREHEHRRTSAGKDVVEVRCWDVRHGAHARQRFEELDRALVDRTDVLINEVVHARAV